MTKIEQLRADLALYGDAVILKDEIKELLDLVEMLHEALKKYQRVMFERDYSAEAVSAFEEWNKP